MLNENGYSNISTEEFENTADLFAAILSKGISLQLKRGLNKSYIDLTEPLSAIKGKINVSDSIKTRSIMKSQLVCSYDEFSENCYFNKILKGIAHSNEIGKPYCALKSSTVSAKSISTPSAMPEIKRV